MRRYAVKLGEIHLSADTPISQSERAEAIKLVEEAAREALRTEQLEHVGMTVVFVPGAA